MNKVLLFVILGVIMVLSAPSGAQTYAISNVAGNLYRFQSNGHYSVFLVTDEGVIVTDPISHQAATWLKGEIKSRFNQPVKYVLYSHSDADHTTGGEVFADTAEFVGQINSKEVFDKSGHSPAPTTIFNEYLSLNLGGKKVELFYPGPSHTDNLIIMSFPDENAIFIVDAVAVNRLPYRNMGNYYFPGVIDFLKFAENIDFDILIPGHGAMGVKSDLSTHRKYLEDLYKSVSTLHDKGIGLEDAKAQVQLEDYKDWSNYEEWLSLNIEGLYRILDDHK